MKTGPGQCNASIMQLMWTQHSIAVYVVKTSRIKLTCFVFNINRVHLILSVFNSGALHMRMEFFFG
jgi:hypothetical protein